MLNRILLEIGIAGMILASDNELKLFLGKSDIPCPASIKKYNFHGRSQFVRCKEKSLLMYQTLKEVVASIVLLHC